MTADRTVTDGDVVAVELITGFRSLGGRPGKVGSAVQWGILARQAIAALDAHRQAQGLVLVREGDVPPWFTLTAWVCRECWCAQSTADDECPNCGYAEGLSATYRLVQPSDAENEHIGMLMYSGDDYGDVWSCDNDDDCPTCVAERATEGDNDE